MDGSSAHVKSVCLFSVCHANPSDLHTATLTRVHRPNCLFQRQHQCIHPTVEQHVLSGVNGPWGRSEFPSLAHVSVTKLQLQSRQTGYHGGCRLHFTALVKALILSTSFSTTSSIPLFYWAAKRFCPRRSAGLFWSWQTKLSTLCRTFTSITDNHQTRTWWRMNVHI